MLARSRGFLAALATLLSLLVGAEALFRASPTREALRDSKRHSALPHYYRTSIDFDPEVVFLGDSRAMYGVDPEAVSRAVEAWARRPLPGYNLALPGAPPIAQLALVDHVLGRGRAPRFVVLHVSPYMFSTANDPRRVREALYSVYTLPGVLHALRAGMPLEDALTAAAHASSELLRYRRGLLLHVLDGYELGAPLPISRAGVESMPPVPYETRRRAARARAREFARMLARPRARFDGHQLRYLEAALRRLRGAGAEVVLVSSPEGPLLAREGGPRTIVPEYAARVSSLASRLGVAFYDYRRTGALRDFEFADGDHMTRAGALRYSALLARDVLAPRVAGETIAAGGSFMPPRPHRGCAIVEDFERLSLTDWRFEGRAFAEGPLSGSTGDQPTVAGFFGVQLLASYHPAEGDAAQGAAVSPPFLLDRPELRLRVGGGGDPHLAVELRVGGEVVRAARGSGTEALVEVRWSVEELRGRWAEIRVVDGSSRAGGHIFVDHIETCSPARADGGPLGGS